MLQNSNAETISNYLTSGAVTTLSGSLNPDEPLSFDHWMSSLGVAITVYSGYKMASSADDVLDKPPVATGNVVDDALPKKPVVGNVADDVLELADDVAEGDIKFKLDVAKVSGMTKQEIKDYIPKEWKYTENHGFVHIRDTDNVVRIRIDPPDKKTPYSHIHINDEAENSLDALGNIVDYRSPNAHMPLKQ